MPHFGLIDEDALGPVEGPLMRAKLHIRSGRRRFERGMLKDGIIIFFDALSQAMQWYIAEPDRRRRLKLAAGDNLLDDRNLYAVLVRSGVLDGALDFERIDALVMMALGETALDFDWRNFMAGLEHVFTQLGVMPFDEKTLPEEPPVPYLTKPAREDGGPRP
ncbi:MAG: hypothetical protein M0Z58_07260 [Nitrospiraceae bacterium]|nr:hypothetical protein [Nitrospiraceae bacterium]